ncbi:hypothetical protein GCM10010168_42380 [Actinoplanes ianthinogenes]|uniref:DUF4097 domain-containing protein n=1 Tax=Actinoplanes ianthinogenes TaxID=122358 RepID=A0ABM7LVV2_9ACTN|nr:DUF4097 family beta strand repeat-containing protein [Actinoplanes ianthinogenes]BCJ43452.1 hypothetical protein Aiant_41090 [Actinoplanes ianthinogenes]GGR20012.1 hypothetical protein GCM10010168_42380 [Actinoplanes ianthinogenes]
MRIWITLLAALAAAPLTACVHQEQTETETRTYDLTDRAAAVVVSSLGGRITVTAGAGDTVHVTETLRYAGAQPAPEHRVVGTDLTFTSGCQGHRGTCGVDYRIEVPAFFRATLDSDGGAVSVTGLSGELDLTSGGGAVEADGIGPVTARTGGGAVRLTFATPPGTVRVDSSGGDVTLRLPRDSYRVDARADGGDTSIEVPTDGAAPRRIGVDSGGGSIVVTPVR